MLKKSVFGYIQVIEKHLPTSPSWTPTQVQVALLLLKGKWRPKGIAFSFLVIHAPLHQARTSTRILRRLEALALSGWKLCTAFGAVLLMLFEALITLAVFFLRNKICAKCIKIWFNGFKSLESVLRR